MPLELLAYYRHQLTEIITYLLNTEIVEFKKKIRSVEIQLLCVGKSLDPDPH